MQFTTKAHQMGLTVTSIQPEIHQVTHSYERYHNVRNTSAQLCYRVSNPILCDTVYKHKKLLLHCQITMDHREVGVTRAARSWQRNTSAHNIRVTTLPPSDDDCDLWPSRGTGATDLRSEEGQRGSEPQNFQQPCWTDW
jgi:hypothetical protein